MTISLVVIYLIYLIFLIGFIVFSWFALYHLSEYGYTGDFSHSMTLIYLTVAATIMLLTVVSLIFFS